MTTTFDPDHALYVDEADVRGELTRVLDVCGSCRRCTDLCGSFTSLFDLLDRGPERSDGAGDLTPAQQDAVVSACYQCHLCADRCPYTPDRHELAVDIPRTFRRHAAMRHATGSVPLGERRTTAVLGRADTLGRVGARLPGLANSVVAAPPSSWRRRVVRVLTGVSSVRVLPPFARERFSTWFRRRDQPHVASPERARAAVYPTCVVEYQHPELGRDLVGVLERNGIRCSVPDVGCCGAPWLHSGDVERFRRAARRTVRVLAQEIRSGAEVVVLQPTCSLVLRQDAPTHVPGADADLVAAHLRDAVSYLIDVHRDDGGLDLRFVDDRPRRVTHHLACHVRVQPGDDAAVELLRLTGAEVTAVAACAGIDGTWGLRAVNDAASIPLSAELADRLTASSGHDRGGSAAPTESVVTGECLLANEAVGGCSGSVPMHPIRFLARAYGLSAEVAGDVGDGADSTH